VLKPLKSKDNFKEFVKDIKERIKDFTKRVKDLILRKKSKAEATTSQESKYKTWLNKFGIDSEQIKKTLKTHGFNMMVWGNFNVNRLKNQGFHETGLKEPSRLDILRNDIQLWK
jgi:hypothetical protein